MGRIKFLVLAMGLFLSTSLWAATFTVTKTADTNDGSCDADCSLREAIDVANGTPGQDIVVIPEGVYLITIVGNDGTNDAGDFDISEGVTLQGAGADKTVIDANSKDRAFDVTNGDITITGMTVQHGWLDADGGAIRTSASTKLIIKDSVLDDNLSKTDVGGGMAVYGSLEMSGVTVSNNMALWGGGGIYLHGVDTATYKISDSKILSNAASSPIDSIGGALKWIVDT